MDGENTLEIQDLLAGKRYYFELRCRNSIGWSEWSPMSRGFVTKPTRPDPCEQVELVETRPQTLSIKWDKPAEHGAEITQYEVVICQRPILIKWMYLAARVTARTPDIASLFPGSQEEFTVGSVFGEEELRKIHFDGAVLAIVGPEKNSYTFEGLVPGRYYHCTVRAKNAAGKGNWSAALGPLRTKSNVPSHCAKLDPILIDNTSCSFAFSLPYDNGERIEQCVIKTTWLNGPTADHEKDPVTRRPHAHIKEREDTFDPWACMPLEDEVDEEGTGDKVEGAKPIYTLNNLLPGTDYQVFWCCVNNLGRGVPSPSVVITTKSHIPDTPGIVMPHAHE